MYSGKINYGIDLGTTNSALAKVEGDKIIIIKSELQKDTTPSCVSFTKKGGLRIGESALNGYRSDLRASLKKSMDPTTNTFIEFKRTMGTDKQYFSSNTNKSYSSEELSAEVLKRLRTYIDNEAIEAAVITVPAKFRQNQLDATQRAAVLAGFRYVELLQEPIAASIAYGLESKKLNGFWMVFDFGGGTFDAALLKVDNGIMKVIDTEGDNHLGGKNIDYQIVDEIFFPYLRKEYNIEALEEDIFRKSVLRDALKTLAEEAKIQLSLKERHEVLTEEPICLDDDGEEIEVDFEIDIEHFNKVIEPIYRRSVDIVKTILERNHLQGDQLETIVLVGGATYTKLIREMLANEICPRIATNVDPMLAVAKGAALFASTKDLPGSLKKIDKDRVQLELIYPETTTELEIKAGIVVHEPADSYTCELIRADEGWSSGYTVLKNGKVAVTLPLLKGIPNTFRIKLMSRNGEIVQTDPDHITVIQGLNIAPSTLPYSICVDTFNSKRQTDLLALLTGLEKNQQLPARGKAVFFTPTDINPGNKKDRIDISIYEGDPETRSIYNEPIGQVIITGEDIEQFMPANQEIELTLEVDASRRMKLSAYLSYIDETIEIKLPEIKQKEYDAEKINAEIDSAKQRLVAMKQEKKLEHAEKIKKLNADLSALQLLLQNARGDYNSKTQIVERLREICILIDNLAYQYEWPKAEAALREAFDGIDDTVARYGDDSHKSLLVNLKRFANQALMTKDIMTAHEIAARVQSLSIELLSRDAGIWSMWLDTYTQQFDMFKWSDKHEAKRIIDTVNRENKNDVMAAVRRLFSLLPAEQIDSVIKTQKPIS